MRGKHDLRYGMQIELLGIRPATDDDAEDGYDFFDLVESSQYDPKELMQSIRRSHRRSTSTIPTCDSSSLTILDEHGDLFSKMPAAQNMHHSYTAGLARARLEHDARRRVCWSTTTPSTTRSSILP